MKNCKQNQKINQVKPETLVVGIDIGASTHYARVFDWRGVELSGVFRFSNDGEGYGSFYTWLQKNQKKHGKTEIIAGCEPTGHYWFNLDDYLREKDIKLVIVNPYAVKQSKELDDNSQTKSDRKDPMVIAKLVTEGRYSVPYRPTGVYADLREMMVNRERIMRDLCKVKNRLARWFSIYFPEYREVFGSYECVSSLLILKVASTPKALIELGPEGINQVWREAKLRAVGKKRAMTLYEAAQRSTGSKEGNTGAEWEMKLLLQDYQAKQAQYEEIMKAIEELCLEIPESQKLMAIKGIGLIAVAGFLAEVGDIRRFNTPKEIQKLAGLSLRENSSGIHKGQTTISKRGRSRLREVLFNAVIPLISTNEEFRELHRYFTTREVNPLKKKQSIIAICNKLIRVFYAILTTGEEYDGQRMLSDIHRNTPVAA